MNDLLHANWKSYVKKLYNFLIIVRHSNEWSIACYMSRWRHEDDSICSDAVRQSNSQLSSFSFKIDVSLVLCRLLKAIVPKVTNAYCLSLSFINFITILILCACFNLHIKQISVYKLFQAHLFQWRCLWCTCASVGVVCRCLWWRCRCCVQVFYADGVGVVRRCFMMTAFVLCAGVIWWRRLCYAQVFYDDGVGVVCRCFTLKVLALCTGVLWWRRLCYVQYLGVLWWRCFCCVQLRCFTLVVSVLCAGVLCWFCLCWVQVFYDDVAYDLCRCFMMNVLCCLQAF